MVDDARGTALLTQDQESLVWFGRIYVLLMGPLRYFPHATERVASWSLGGAGHAVPVVHFGFKLLLWNLQFRPESQNPLAPEPSRFNYMPLKDSQTMRVLRVHRSLRGDAPISCDLLQVPLGDDGPFYDAISYRWEENAGAATKSETILINGFGFDVYPNVLAILKDVRSPIVSRCIWIDSICINQGDTSEKEVQVALMRHIYAGSTKVMIHLSGSRPTPTSMWSEFLGLFSNDETASDVATARIMITKLRDSRVLQDYAADDSPMRLFSLARKRDWDAVERLLSNTWFERAWIVQEVAVARRIHLRYCGRDFNWDDFVRAASALSRSGMGALSDYRRFQDGRTGQLELPGVENTLILHDLRQWYATGQLLTLLDTMILCLRFKSKWPVDKIFAMLGIIDQTDRKILGIQPDYTADETDIFTYLAWRLIDNGSLDDQFRLLRFAGIGQLRNPALPSWVPRLDGGDSRLRAGASEREVRLPSLSAPDQKDGLCAPARHGLAKHGRRPGRSRRSPRVSKGGGPHRRHHHDSGRHIRDEADRRLDKLSPRQGPRQGSTARRRRRRRRPADVPPDWPDGGRGLLAHRHRRHVAVEPAGRGPEVDDWRAMFTKYDDARRATYADDPGAARGHRPPGADVHARRRRGPALHAPGGG